MDADRSLGVIEGRFSRARPMRPWLNGSVPGR